MLHLGFRNHRVWYWKKCVFPHTLGLKNDIKQYKSTSIRSLGIFHSKIIESRLLIEDWYLNFYNTNFEKGAKQKQDGLQSLNFLVSCHRDFHYLCMTLCVDTQCTIPLQKDYRIYIVHKKRMKLSELNIFK